MLKLGFVKTSCLCYIIHMQTPFLSKEVNLKRIFKGLGISLLTVIPLIVIISNFVTFIFPKEETKVLGTEDTNTSQTDLDYEYTKEADLYVNGEWKPEGYIPLERSIDNPGYPVEAGTTLKKTYDLGNGNTLSLECQKIEQQYLDIPPYWPKCTLELNDLLITNNLRSDVNCDTYGPDATGCKELVGIVLYKLSNSSDMYLFLSSGNGAGSVYLAMPYLITDNSYTKLYFDFKDYISEDKYVRSGLGMDSLYLAYTDDSKTEVRLISMTYDPAMQTIGGVYHEWKFTNNRLLLEKKIVSQ